MKFGIQKDLFRGFQFIIAFGKVLQFPKGGNASEEKSKTFFKYQIDAIFVPRSEGYGIRRSLFPID